MIARTSRMRWNQSSKACMRAGIGWRETGRSMSTEVPRAGRGNQLATRALHWPHLFEQALELPWRGDERRRWWDRAGVSPRGERVFDVLGPSCSCCSPSDGPGRSSNAKTLARADGDVGGRSPARAAIASALPTSDAPTTAYLTDAALNALTDRMLDERARRERKAPRGDSTDAGAAHARHAATGRTLGVLAAAETSSPRRRAPGSGACCSPSATPSARSRTSTSSRCFRSARSRTARSGSTTSATGRARRGAVGPSKGAARRRTRIPPGFIEVTQQNADTPVSEHFKLRDFLTHDQPNVWPKYLVLQQKLIDKLELVLGGSRRRTASTSRGVRVMSGFRTPQYNEAGGNTGGRANLSRHMYGDASDIYIDNNGDGQMDDLNHDGRITHRRLAGHRGGRRPRRGRSSGARSVGQASIRRRPGTDLSFTSTRAAIARGGRGPQEADVAEQRRMADGGVIDRGDRAAR